jgi:hypothetical protein
MFSLHVLLAIGLAYALIRAVMTLVHRSLSGMLLTDMTVEACFTGIPVLVVLASRYAALPLPRMCLLVLTAHIVSNDFWKQSGFNVRKITWSFEDLTTFATIVRVFGSSLLSTSHRTLYVFFIGIVVH